LFLSFNINSLVSSETTYNISWLLNLPQLGALVLGAILLILQHQLTQ